MNQADQDAITKAHELTKQINALHEQIDELLTPICVKAMAEAEYDDLKALRDALPEGFHRTEIRTYINGL